MTTFEKWYESGDPPMKDIIVEYYQDINYLINNSEDMEFDYDTETLYRRFIQFMYKTYVEQKKNIFYPYDEEMYDYFSMKFSSDIIDIFMKWKNLSVVYNIGLLHNITDTSIDIEYFLFNHVLVKEPYNDETEDPYENNIEDTINEAGL